MAQHSGDKIMRSGNDSENFVPRKLWFYE